MDGYNPVDLEWLEEHIKQGKYIYFDWSDGETEEYLKTGGLDEPKWATGFDWVTTEEGLKYWQKVVPWGRGSPDYSIKPEDIEKMKRIRDGYLLGLRENL